MSKIGEILVQITASNTKLRAGLAEASSLIRDWSLVTTGLTAGVTNAFKTIASVGIKAVTVALAAMAGTFALVAKSGAEFEDNILRAFVIMRESSGATARELSVLTNTAIEMGSETLFSANEAAQGLQILARAGFSAKEAVAAIKPVVDLAIVGNMSLAETSNVAVSSMYGFGLGAEDMSRVSDVLSVASSQANTTVQLLGSSLSFVAPVAKSAGLSIEETSAALGILSNAGIRGSRAGTTLRRALSVLLAPTGRAKKVFKELGLTFTDSSGKLESFSKIMKKLESANLTAAQTMEIFGLRAGPGMAALLAEGSSALDKMTDRLNSAEGAADRMSQEFRTTVKGRMRDLGASVTNLGLAFSEEFKKPLADTIFAIRNYIKEITEAWKKSGVFKAIVVGIIDALSPLTDKIVEVAQAFKQMLLKLTTSDVGKFFDGLKEKVQAFITVISSGTFLKNVIATFTGISNVVKGFLKSLKMLGDMFDALPDGVEPLIVQLTSAAAAFTFLMGGIQNIISPLIIVGQLMNFMALQTMAAALGSKKVTGANLGIILSEKAKAVSLTLSNLVLGIQNVLLVGYTANMGLAATATLIFRNAVAAAAVNIGILAMAFKASAFGKIILMIKAICIVFLKWVAIIASIGYFIYKMVEVFNIFGGWENIIDNIANAWDRLGFAIGRMWTDFKLFLNDIPILSGLVQFLTDVFNVLGQAIGWVAGKLGGIFKWIAKMTGIAFNMDEFFDDMKKGKDFINDKFKNIFDGSADKLKDDVDALTLDKTVNLDFTTGKTGVTQDATKKLTKKEARRRDIYGGGDSQNDKLIKVMTAIGEKVMPKWEAIMLGYVKDPKGSMSERMQKAQQENRGKPTPQLVALDESFMDKSGFIRPVSELIANIKEMTQFQKENGRSEMTTNGLKNLFDTLREINMSRQGSGQDIITGSAITQGSVLTADLSGEGGEGEDGVVGKTGTVLKEKMEKVKETAMHAYNKKRDEDLSALKNMEDIMKITGTLADRQRQETELNAKINKANKVRIDQLILKVNKLGGSDRLTTSGMKGLENIQGGGK